VVLLFFIAEGMIEVVFQIIMVHISGGVGSGQWKVEPRRRYFSRNVYFLGLPAIVVFLTCEKEIELFHIILICYQTKPKRI
jgi:hypothetical protein